MNKPSRPLSAWSTACPPSFKPLRTNWATRSLSSTSRIFMTPPHEGLTQSRALRERDGRLAAVPQSPSALSKLEGDIIGRPVACHQQGHGFLLRPFRLVNLGGGFLRRRDRAVADTDDDVALLEAAFIGRAAFGHPGH